MASVVDWNTLGGEQKGSGGGGRGRAKFMKFESGKMYTVRPVGKAWEFFKFFVKPTNRSIVVAAENVDAAAAMLSEEFGQEIKPQHRYVMNVLDREDNSIKILEGGQQIFNQFSLWAKGNKAHPGGMSGGDWLIQVQGDGLNRKYNAQCIRPSPLSEEEMKRVKEGGEVHDLESMYSSVPLEDVIAKARGDADPGHSNDIPKAKQGYSKPAQKPQQAPVAAPSVVGDGDLW